MKRLIGFALLCAAAGMLILLLIPATSLLRILLFLIFIGAGYFLFCK